MMVKSRIETVGEVGVVIWAFLVEESTRLLSGETGTKSKVDEAAGSRGHAAQIAAETMLFRGA